MSFPIADVALIGGVATNGVIMEAWKGSRFGGLTTVPLNAPPPAGGPDAGPTLSGINFGGVGNYEILVPTAEPYFVSGTLGSTIAWQYFPNVGAGISGGPAVPALTLGAANSMGAALSFVASDATIAAFDATLPTTVAYGGSSAAGSAAKAARRDHGHAGPAQPGAVISPLTAAGAISLRPSGIASNALSVSNAVAPDAVNGLTVKGSATGTAVTVGAAGTDTDVSLLIQPKGAGSTFIASGGLSVTGGVSATTVSASGTVTASTSLNSPLLNLTGASGVTIAPTGANPVKITGGASASPGTALTVAGVSSGINYVTVTNAATGNRPLIQATGGDASVDLALGGVGTTGGIRLVTGASGVVTLQTGVTQQIFDASANLTAPNWKVAANDPSILHGGNNLFTLHDVTPGSGNNYLQVSNAADGSAPILGSVGTATDVGLQLLPKGAGVVDLHYASVALGGGAAPTLGTIGGSGPATAGQNAWLKVLINGTASWVPFWR